MSLDITFCVNKQCSKKCQRYLSDEVREKLMLAGKEDVSMCIFKEEDCED